MTFSIPAIIRAHVASFLAPGHRLSCRSTLWREGLAELRRRGNARRESGAFLLASRGENSNAPRRITRFVYYDDLDANCLDTGIVVFRAAGFGPLWQLCRDLDLTVVADVHTHPGAARQSDADRRHPMIATAGHIAVIVPDYAKSAAGPPALGLYEYQGAHQWRDYSGHQQKDYFYIGLWG